MKTWKKTIPKVGIHRCIRKTIIIVQCSNIHSSLFHISNPCQCSQDIIGSLQQSAKVYMTLSAKYKVYTYSQFTVS